MAISIHYYYDVDRQERECSEYETSYATKREAWGYVRRLAQKAIAEGMDFEGWVTDADDVVLLDVYCDGDRAFAVRPDGSHLILAERHGLYA